jgi:hypothetical protein
MAHTNRYYIINSEDPNLPQIEAVIVGDPNTQRYNLDGSKLVVKLHQGDHKEYPFLDGVQEYNHEQILEALNNSEWQQTIP